MREDVKEVEEDQQMPEEDWEELEDDYAKASEEVEEEEEEMENEEENPEREASNCFPSSAEEMDVDPFYHRLRLGPLQWLRTVLLSVTLFPLRILLVLLCVLTAWVICLAAMAGWTRKELSERPLTGWRRRLRHAAMFLGRRCSNAAGFWVSVRGRRVSPEEAPVLVVAPHSTFFDGMVPFWCGAPYLVSREENR